MSNQDWRVPLPQMLVLLCWNCWEIKGCYLRPPFLSGLPLEVEQWEVQTSEQWYLLWQSNLAKHLRHHMYQTLQMN